MLTTRIWYRLEDPIRRFVWKYPTLYRPLGRIRRGADVFDLDYDLSIEGYPRSANTYLLRLLQATQPALRIRSHRHIPPHAIAALHNGLPVLFLIRPPLDCVTSFAILCGTTATRHLVSYVGYHKVMRPYLDQLFIADFSTVTSDPRPMLQKFARKYQLPLDVDFDLGEARTQAFVRIDQDHTSEDGQLNEQTVNRPVAGRSSQKAVLLAELEQPVNRRWLAQANALYAEFQAQATA